MSNTKKNGHLKPLIIIVVILAIVIGAGVVFYNTGIAAVSDNTDEITVEIPNGSGAYDIINRLDEAGLVKNKTCAKIYVKLNSTDNLQANTYVLNKSMSLPEIMDIIENGTFEYVLKSKFTIIEGETVPSAAEEISEQFGFSKEDILNMWGDIRFLKELINDYWFLTDDILNPDIIYPLEGYLYPDTYFSVEKKPSIESITRQILDNTDKNLSTIKNDISNFNMSIHELITFASIVENESLFEEDRPKIAGVFINRLNDGMMLQSDITVLYALQKKTVDVTYQDLEVDSRYNTYKYDGLPVGPVSCPSLSTIKDCLNYEKNEYLYFFATKDGKVIYSKSFAEHEKAVNDNMWY